MISSHFDRGRKPTARFRQGAARFLGFAAVPMFNAVTPLLVLPAITANFGASAWATVAVAQSLGAAGTTATELGWGMTGPQRVARQSERNRQSFFVHVVVTKAIAALPVMAIAAVVASLVVNAFRWEAAVLAAVGCLGSLSNAWFFIGAGRPAGIILSDSLPRIVPLAVCAVLLMLGWPFVTYVMTMIVVAVLVPLCGLLAVGVGPTTTRLLSPRVLRHNMWAQRVALTGRVLSSMYIALPVTLVSIVNPQAVAVFAAAERLQRMSLTVLQAVPNMLQGWVGKATHREERYQRALRGLVINCGVGMVCGLGFALVAPLASELIFSGVATVSHGLASVCGLLIAVVCTSRVTGGIMLVVLRRVDAVATSALVGCAVGVPAILVFATVWGSYGAVMGEILGELAVLSVQIGAVLRARRTAGGTGRGNE